MCGIAGFVGKGNEEVIRAMTNTLSHRGPDDENYYIDGETHFGFRRLSIIDVVSGRQPISNEDGTVVVMFNGEIYNYQALQKEVQALGHHLKTKSDTEVIAHLYEEVGEKVFEKLQGMFAIALWDKKKRQLLLARDRLGKKPLYYSLRNGTLIFGSEPKALLKYPDFKRSINQDALSLYLGYEFVPTPYSIYENIHKLEEGSFLRFANGSYDIKRYWDITLEDKLEKTLQENIKKLDTLLGDAVASRLVSDVPLGVYLSGGLDSSTIAWYAQKASKRPINTFSIAFDEKSYDESAYARMVAGHIGSYHHEERLTITRALDMVEKSASFFDEPLADASLLPTMLLAQFSRKHVTVALGGDGGDELFLGYPNFRAHKLQNIYRRFPSILGKNIIPWLVSRLPSSDDYFSFPFKAKRFLRGQNEEPLIQDLFWRGSFSPDEKRALLLHPLAKDLSLELIRERLSGIYSNDFFQKLSYLYLKQYLMDDVMVKVDRASMAFSQEVRAPFLDSRVVEFAANLPTSFKLHNSEEKYILKKLMAGRLPAGIINRPKKGFGVPVSAWLRKELRPLCEEFFSKSYLEKQGIFQPKIVEHLYRGHLKRRADHRKELWTLLTFQLWYNKWSR